MFGEPAGIDFCADATGWVEEDDEVPEWRLAFSVCVCIVYVLAFHESFTFCHQGP